MPFPVLCREDYEAASSAAQPVLRLVWKIPHLFGKEELLFLDPWSRINYGAVRVYIGVHLCLGACRHAAITVIISI